MLSLIRNTTKGLGIMALISSAVAVGMYMLDESTQIPEQMSERIPVMKGAIEKTAYAGEALTNLGHQSYQIVAESTFPNAQVSAQQKEAKLKLNQIQQKIKENQQQQEQLESQLAKLNQEKLALERIANPLKRFLPESVSQGFNFMAQEVPLPLPNQVDTPLPGSESKQEDCSCP